MPGELDRDYWHPPIIRGEKVVLRRPRADDLPHVRRWYADDELTRLTRYQTRPMSETEVELFFRSRLLAPDALAYAIVELPSERLVGFTTFSGLDPDNGSVLYHITIGERDAWNHGLGTEATGLMLSHAFGRLGLHRVGLTVFEFNARAIRAYEKAGFRIEGRHRQAVRRDGRFWDEVVMGVLDDEWRAHAAQPAGAPDQASAAQPLANAEVG